jgi:hypothetical protein
LNFYVVLGKGKNIVVCTEAWISSSLFRGSTMN